MRPAALYPRALKGYTVLLSSRNAKLLTVMLGVLNPCASNDKEHYLEK